MVRQALVRRKSGSVNNFFNSAFKFLWNFKVLSCLAPEAFEFAETFSKPARLPRQAFKSGVHLAARFSKESCSLATYLLDLKTGEMPLAVFKSSRCNSETSVIQ
jgi:hypothetical protein